MQSKVNVKHIKSKTFVESESYKKLRTNIQFSGKDMRVIAFTSSYPGEGKSEVAYRAAYSMAEMGKKTIFIDTDLRNSSFLNRITEGIKGELKGLVHCLVGENSLDEIIVSTQNPNLDFIPIGAIPPNPSELLSQDIFSEIISELKSRYDYVIMDTAPAGYVVDGVISSKAADGVIFIVESGNISAKLAKATVNELTQAGCKMIGSVLNKCTKESGGQYGYGYGYGYVYGYGYGNTDGYSAGFSSSKGSKILSKLFLGKSKK